MRLNDAPTGETIEKLMRLYTEAFPPDERRPVEQMPPEDEAFTLYAVEDDHGRTAGLMTVWDFREEGFNYVEHFATLPELRGRGLGGRALALLPGPTVLEVEPAETGDTARRRIAFYERNGFRLLDHKYIQPPYSAGLKPLELRLMMRGEAPVTAEKVAETLHRRVYGVAE